MSGPTASALVDWCSRRQLATAKSTPEAEAVAGSDAIRAAPPVIAIGENAFQRDFDVCVLIDNDAAKSAFREGYSRKLRYLRKYQKVSLGFIRDSLSNSNGKLERVDSSENNSDIHTKHLDRVAFLKHRAAMGVEDCAQSP